MSDKKKEHIADRACWCNPYVLSEGSKVISEYAGKIVATTPIGFGQIAVHIEPHEEQPA